MRKITYYNGKPKSSLRVYKIWQGMKRRCYNKNDMHYYLYGGSGIKICDEWLDPDTFIQWALSNGYKDHLEIDRIDPTKDYMPENCRWITKKKNASRARKPYSTKYSKAKRSHKIWEECKAAGCKMDNFPEPLYPWEEDELS